MRVYSPLIDFVFPSSCAVCGQAPSPVCQGCLPEFSVRRSELGKTPVWYAHEYDEPIGKLLRSYKDDARTSLASKLAPALAALLAEAARETGPEVIRLTPRNRANYKNAALIPWSSCCLNLETGPASRLSASCPGSEWRAISEVWGRLQGLETWVGRWKLSLAAAECCS